MPTSVIPDVVGMGVLDMLVKTGLLPSKGRQDVLFNKTVFQSMM